MWACVDQDNKTPAFASTSSLVCEQWLEIKGCGRAGVGSFRLFQACRELFTPRKERSKQRKERRAPSERKHDQKVAPAGGKKAAQGLVWVAGLRER